MIVSNISERLHELLEKNGLRQVDFLRKIEPFCEVYNVKFSKSHLSLYLSGKVVPGLKKLELVSKAFGVRLSWLIGCDVPMN